MSDMMETNKKSIKMFDAPGQGRKQCPKCGIYVASRTTVCNCGHNWKSETAIVDSAAPKPKRQKKILPPTEPKLVVARTGCGLLSAPGGPSLEAGLKVKLQAQSPEDYPAFADWADKMIGMGQTLGFNYGPLALRYFLRYYYNINSQEYKTAVVTLNQWSLEYFAVENS